MDAKRLHVRAAALAKKASSRFRSDSHAVMGNIGTLVLAIVAGIVVPVIAIGVMADLLPDYGASLGSIFTSLAAVDTTGWPAIVVTLWELAPLILGVTAIAALFGLGSFLAIRIRNKGAGA